MVSSRIKPIYMMNTRGVTDFEKQAVRDAIQTVLKTARVDRVIDIKDFGYWNQGPGDFESLDWYVDQSMTNNSSGYGRQLYGARVLSLCGLEPWQRNEPHYEVFVVDKDLHSPGLNFIIGLSNYLGTVFSVVRFRGLGDRMKYECIKTEGMHELGHTFTAAAGRKGIDALTGESGDVSMLYDNHCANECVMRQGNVVPQAWIKISQDRLRSGKAFCGECTDDMISFFRK